jgi:hypothetical protein
MRSEGDEKVHNKRRKKRETNIGELLRHGRLTELLLESRRQNPEFEFLHNWGVPIRTWPDDVRTSDIIERLYKVWPRLSADNRRLYLQAAESIAEAEKAKGGWNPKAKRRQYACLAKTTVAAAKLVGELSRMFPPPWVGDETKLGELVFGLASFVSGSVAATFPWGRDEAVHTASALLRTAKKRVARKTGGMRWELVRDLVWLASSKRITLDERTVRRYLKKQASAKNPVKAYLRPNWELFGYTYGLAQQWRAQSEVVSQLGQPEALPELGTPRLDSEPFKRAALKFLTTASISNTSTENPA